MEPKILSLLQRLAWYYEVNDCQDRSHDDALEVPVADLKAAFDLVALHGVAPAP